MAGLVQQSHILLRIFGEWGPSGYAILAISRAAAARELDIALPSSSSESWKSSIALERSSTSAWQRGGVVTRSIISWSYSRRELRATLVID